MNIVIKIFALISFLIILIFSSCRTSHPEQYVMDIHGGRYDRAEYWLNNDIKRRPDYWEPYYWMGIVKYERKDYKNSIKYLKKAAILDSTQYDNIKKVLELSIFPVLCATSTT